MKSENWLTYISHGQEIAPPTVFLISGHVCAIGSAALVNFDQLFSVFSLTWFWTEYKAKGQDNWMIRYEYFPYCKLETTNYHNKNTFSRGYFVPILGTLSVSFINNWLFISLLFWLKLLMDSSLFVLFYFANRASDRLGMMNQTKSPIIKFTNQRHHLTIARFQTKMAQGRKWAFNDLYSCLQM